MALPDTSCHYCIVPWRDLVLPDSTRYCCSTWLYLTLLYIKPWLYFILLHCSIALLCTTWFYYILYLALLDSTTLCHGSTWCYYTLLHCTVALLGSTYIVPWLYLTLLDSTTIYTVALLDCTMALLRSTWLYYIRHIVRWYKTTRGTTRDYETLWDRRHQCDTMRHRETMVLYQTYSVHCSMALLGSTWLY